MIGAILLGLAAGIIGRLLVPDMWSGLSGPKSWLFSLVLGLAGAMLGYLIFTVGLGIGDTDVFDWGGIIGAIIGVIILLPFVGIFTRFSRGTPDLGHGHAGERADRPHRSLGRAPGSAPSSAPSRRSTPISCPSGRRR